MTVPPSAPTRTFEWIDSAIPRYESFFTVAEHRDRDRALAAEHDHLEYDEHGESANGETLWTVTVGDGDRSALLFGAPHPNEPIGSMTIDFLLHELATNDELRASLDYEFVCLPVADPDGVRLNEGWFDGPFTLSNYAQNFYRTPPDEQVEATFPVEREGYAFDDPAPGTRALMDLIETLRPEFIYSFHNAAFGGCYYYLSEPLEPLYDALSSLPGEYDVPLHRGEPEWFAMEAFDDVVYRLPTFADQFDDVQDQDDVDPEAALLGGNAYDYATRFNEDVVELVVELPYFHDPQIQDRTELERTRADVIQDGVRKRQTLLEAMRDGADAVDEHFLRQYHLLTYLGMLVRSIDRAAMSADEDARETLAETKAALEDVFFERLEDIRTQLDYEMIPIWKLVAIQARVGLLCLDSLQDRPER
ncbi:M14 family zinc carboxypeptidase [Haloterrigena salifodinae]|uniref:M14 family zinc carboxypeptidase n=1 Tax=Haloterrigena salifodinae TaxID=2675099 RepID=UPI000F875B26|nr:M14 family zinc carboxypeptidase [Haloterrigena salifodinae]